MHTERQIAMSEINELEQRIREIIDRTGLDEVTAATIASAREAPPRDQAPKSITSVMLQKALTAPPTANEPTEPPPTALECPDCGGGGWYKLEVPYGHPDFGALFACRCKGRERASKAAARRSQILQELDAELGGDLARCTFASYSTTHPKDTEQCEVLTNALQAAMTYAASLCGWLYLWGPCGSGKSHLAAAVAHEAATRGMRSSYASVPALLRFLKAGFGDGSSDTRMHALQQVDLLVLDDIGAEYHKHPGDWGDATLFELINQRCLYDRPTVFTSNMPPAELEPRIGSRIRGRARIVFLLVDDYRTRRKL
jgi:DNA replication protein DnaC